jgi:hypothetical protein
MSDVARALTLVRLGSSRVRSKAIEELCQMAGRARSGIEIMDKYMADVVDALEVEQDPAVFVRGCKSIANSLQRWIVTEPELLRCYCTGNQVRAEIFVTVVSFIQDNVFRPSSFRFISAVPIRPNDIVASISLLLNDPQVPQSEFMRFWQKVLLAHAALGFHWSVEPGGEHLLTNLLFFDPMVSPVLSGGQRLQYEQPGEMVAEPWEKIAGLASVRSKPLLEKILNIRSWLALNKSSDLARGWVFAEDPHRGIRARYALNSLCPKETREKILGEICDVHQRLNENELQLVWLRKRNNILHVQNPAQHKYLITYQDESEFRSRFVSKPFFPLMLSEFFSKDPVGKVAEDLGSSLARREGRCQHASS